MKGINIMSNLYGHRARIYLINSFSITAANFMKNLVFHGGPRIKPGIVVINNIESLVEHMSEFNNCSSNIGVTLEKCGTIVLVFVVLQLRVTFWKLSFFV